MNGSAVDPLERFYSTTPRKQPKFDSREGIRGHVDAMLAHLRIPCEIDPDGDWLIENDSGRFTLFVRPADERIVLRQKVMTLDSDVSSYAEDLELLLEMNLRAEGACFALQGVQDRFMVVLTGQLPCDELDAQKFASMLESAFRLSYELDEVLGEDEPEPDPELVVDEPLPEPEAAPEPDHLGVDPQSMNGNGNGASPDDSWPANWYEDPQGEARLRYWDGTAWTDYTAV
jgi:hypothetical protein